MKKILLAIMAFALVGTASNTWAQENTAPADAAVIEVETDGLEELLRLVEEGRVAETAWHRQREAEFIAQRSRQQQLLREANQTKANEERRSERLEATFQTNETELTNLTQRLQDRMGNLSELFGVLQQVAGDTRSVFAGSLMSVHYPNREEGISALIEKSGGSQLPSIAEIEGLWFEMQREMTASGEVVKFPYTVAAADGQSLDVDLIRIGDFNLAAEGKYFVYSAETGRVEELARQPSGRFTGTIDDLEDADAGEIVAFGIDPSRGQLLRVMINAPSWMERFDQGGPVGYFIAFMGLIGIALVIERTVYLSGVAKKVRGSMKSGAASSSNPLGRVLTVYQNNKNVDVETLELKLDEAILKETPALERFLTVIKMISAVAPLFGLLGTVIGMIATFQAITLFGTGDPQLMAGGISQALVTTVLGLLVAIPTLFLHSLVAGMSKGVIHILEEQSAGIIASHAEKEAANG
ncbi:MAG: MotA/TolQ/ExbB proton channel family protein [Sphingomonadales bacterium]|nr:MotA/TolQ/ExbB proton channel family protein [Sphingomonadales bacterium]